MRRIERWIFAAGTAERLAILRIGLCTVLTLRLIRGIFLDLAGQPAALFEPRSFMNLLGAQPSRGIVLAIQVAGVAAGVLAVIGLYARASLPVAWAASVFLNGMVTSNGKIMHNDVMLLLALMPLLAAPVSDAWSLDARRRRKGSVSPSPMYGWPVRTAMIAVAGGYFFTGLAKLVHSGPAWFTSDNLRWVLYTSSDSQGAPNDIGLFIADHAWLAHLMAFATLTLEVSFPLVLFRARLTAPYVLGAIGLHTGIWLTMRLNYVVWATTAAVVLVDWPRVAAKVRGGMREGAGQGPAPSANEPSRGLARNRPLGTGETLSGSVSRRAASASPLVPGRPGEGPAAR